jgi:hypothetical protein
LKSQSRNKFNGKGKKQTAIREASMAELKAQITALMKQFCGTTEIAERLGIAKSTADRYRQAIMADWRASAAVDRDELFATMLRNYVHDRDEAYAGLERSKKPKQRKTVKETDDGLETTIMEEGQAGDPSFLLAAMRASDAIRDLTGLDAPKKQELTGRDGMPLIPAGDVPEAIAALLADPLQIGLELTLNRKHLREDASGGQLEPDSADIR